MAKKKAIPHKTWRPKLEDVKLLVELKAQLGVGNETDVLRMGLRALQREQQGLRR